MSSSSSMSKRRLFKPDLSNSFGDTTNNNNSNNNNNNNSTWRSNTTNIVTTSANEDGTITSEVTATLTSEQMIDRLVAAAALLTTPDQLMSVNIVEKLVDEINRELTNRLIKMINVTSTHVVESNLINRTSLVGIENNPKFLGQLIELAFEQFKCMARLYRHFIETAIAKLGSMGTVSKYQWANVWTCIQNVLMQLLDEYLDIRQMSQNQSSVDMLEKIDINSFFVRRRLINLGFGDSSAPSAAESGGDTDEKHNHHVFTFKGNKQFDIHKNNYKFI